MKKITFLFLIVFALSASFVFADSDGMVIENCEFIPNENVSSIENPNVGVTEIPDLMTDSLYVPKDTKDLSNDSYSFSGSARTQKLYTNYKFNGKSSYTIKVTNNHDNDNLKLYVYKNTSWKSCKSASVPTGGTTTFKVKGLSKSDTIYIKFVAPSNFSGKIY